MPAYYTTQDDSERRITRLKSDTHMEMIRRTPLGSREAAPPQGKVGDQSGLFVVKLATPEVNGKTANGRFPAIDVWGEVCLVIIFVREIYLYLLYYLVIREFRNSQ